MPATVRRCDRGKLLDAGTNEGNRPEEIRETQGSRSPHRTRATVSTSISPADNENNRNPPHSIFRSN